MVVWFFGQLFGAHVQLGPHLISVLTAPGGLGRQSVIWLISAHIFRFVFKKIELLLASDQAKIADFDSAVCAEEDVVRLEISVNEALTVNIFNTKADLSEHSQ